MSQLIGVACTSATGCLAVGFSSPNFFNNQSPATLAERWNGSTWRVEHTPNPPGAAASNLNAASCVSPSACIAVGNTSNSRGTSLTLAQRWNGHTWSIQPTPSPPGHGFKLLNGVACTSRSFCMAVGNEFDTTGKSLGTVADRWNGRTWRIVPTFKPAPAGPNAAFNGVACTSASGGTAVGNQTLAKTLAERWNGRTWQVQPTPNPAGAQNITLASVACPARTVCTAFGLNQIGSGAPVTLAERWSGGRWRIQPTPGLVAFDIGFPGAACPTSSASYAVASYTNSGPSLTLTEQWNQTGTNTQAATGRRVAAGAWRPAPCLPPASAPACWAHIPPTAGSQPRAWSQYRAGSSPNWAGSLSPASRIWCGAG
jgi:hypothetical protein